MLTGSARPPRLVLYDRILFASTAALGLFHVLDALCLGHYSQPVPLYHTLPWLAVLLLWMVRGFCWQVLLVILTPVTLIAGGFLFYPDDGASLGLTLLVAVTGQVVGSLWIREWMQKQGGGIPPCAEQWLARDRDPTTELEQVFR